MKTTESGLPIVDQQELQKLLKKSKEKNKGLIVMGRTGIGKTYTMEKWVEEQNQELHPYPFIQYDATEIVLNYGSHGMKIFESKHESEHGTVLYRLKNKKHNTPVFIDDLGHEIMDQKHFGTSYPVLAHVIKLAYENKHPLYATTNLNVEELTQRYGVRIIDRLKEMGGIVVLEGPNYREAEFSNNLTEMEKWLEDE